MTISNFWKLIFLCILAIFEDVSWLRDLRTVVHNVPPGGFSAILPFMFFFSTHISFRCRFFLFLFFYKTFCYTICLPYVFVIILPNHCFLCLHFTPGTFHLVSKITGWYASLNPSTPMFLDVCQTILEQRHDLFRAQISTPSWHC